uniref:Uncharacterized protein n=1 Tax=Anguilla anguilla TaxID=7936 RepID=A0A0E9TG07_ANGAN
MGGVCATSLAAMVGFCIYNLEFMWMAKNGSGVRALDPEVCFSIFPHSDLLPGTSALPPSAQR